MIENPKTDLYFDLDERKIAENFNRYFNVGDEESIKYIPNFNQINIFVGANNSGKSMFMRELMKMRKGIKMLHYRDLKCSVDRLNSLIKALDIKWKATFQHNKIWNENNPLFFVKNNQLIELKEVNSLEFHFSFKLLNVDFNKEYASFEKIKKIYNNQVLLNEYKDINSMKGVSKELTKKIKNLDENFKELKIIINKSKYIGNKEIVYIPTLRSAHSIFQFNTEVQEYKKVTEDIFLETYIKNYGIQNAVNDPNNKFLDVFTGLDLYNQILLARNGSKEQRLKFEAFEKFFGENFFGGSIDIVAQFNIYEKAKNKDENEIIKVQLEGSSEQNLYELGDGIQAIIILLFKVFMANKDAVIFIDEPELNLHPGMQRLFLDQITNNKELTDKNLTYVIATHSNHLLDLTLEHDTVSIYSFNSKNDEKFEIRNVNLGNNSLLRDLGVNNSSVFLANKTIWVEGVSDRNYLKAFLIAYYASKKEVLPKEDLDFAFFEYAGSNIAHYIFDIELEGMDEFATEINALALSNDIFLLADGDGVDLSIDSAKSNRLKELRKSSKIKFYLDEDYREIENFLPNEIWGKVLIKFCNKSKTIVEGYVKSTQSEINEKLKDINSQNYKMEYIGEFLSKLNLPDLNKIYKEVENKKGTFIYKRKLSELVLQKTIGGELTWDHFSKSLGIDKLSKTLYAFLENK